MNDLYLLRPQSVVKEGDARDVTARPVEASDKSSLNRIGTVCEDDWDFRRGRFGGERGV
jgi:hypothetical protein